MLHRALLLATALIVIEPIRAQNSPTASSLSGMVDKFTGDLSYSLPLLTVPGPNGEAFPLMLQYQSGGIGTDQAASEVGLGWTIPIGEISRRVNGFPDDIKARPYQRIKLSNSAANNQTIENLLVYGPLYFRSLPSPSDATMQHGCTTCTAMDLYSTRSSLPTATATFEFPDYDDYTAIGPSLQANLGFHLFDYSSIFQRPKLTNPEAASNASFSHIFGDYYSKATRKPCFVINEGRSLNIAAQINRNYRTFTGNATPMASIPVPPGDASASPGDVLQQGIRTIPKSGYYVTYATNEELHAYLTANTAMDINGFLDWSPGGTYPARNNTTAFDPDGIGAIQVVDPNGFTYHYSLPIYALPQKRFVFDLEPTANNGWTLPSTFTNPLTGEPFGQANQEIELFDQNFKFASTWKLTAITGPDFEDVDGNHYPDNSDNGYWIRFDYAKWNISHDQRFPTYGFQEDLSGKEINLRNPSRLTLTNGAYRKTGSTLYNATEVYYLNSVNTSTHVAVLLHDVRYDEHSTSNPAKPLLKLSEILLLRREDYSASAFPSSIPPNHFPFQSHSTTGVAAGNVFNSAQAATTNIRSLSLASVVLHQDYSLAKRHPVNIKSGHLAGLNADPRPIGGHNIYFNQPSSASPTDLGASGKLTLKSVVFKQDGAEQLIPSYDFTYFDAIDGDPLDATQSKKDHFGHYKHDHNPLSGAAYTTRASGSRLHAWSLKTIHDPLGGLITVTYEPDEYNLVGYGNSLPSYPERFFWLKNITGTMPDMSGLQYGTTQLSGAQIEVFDYSAIQDLSNPTLSNVRDASLFIRLGLYRSSDGAYVFETGSYVDRDLSWSSATGSTVNVARIGNYPLGGFEQNSQTPSGFVPVVFGNSLDDYLKIRYNSVLGGGIRVARLETSDANSGAAYGIRFKYTQGICSAEPDPYDRDEPRMRPDGTVNSYGIYSVVMNRSGGDRHAPPAAVGYTLVTEEIADADGESAGGAEHEFINYIEPYRYLFRRTFNSPTYQSIHEAVECTVGGSVYGKPSSTMVIDKHGNALSQTIYKYETNPSSAIEEAFCRVGSPSTFISTYINGVVSSGQPTIHTLFVKKRNYRRLKTIEHHENSAILITEFDNVDLNTGEPATTRIAQAGIGDRTATRTSAYAEHSALGPKWQNATNKNILTPAAKVTSTDGTGSRSDWAELHAIRKFDASVGCHVSVVQSAQWAPTKNYIKSTANSTTWKYLGRPTLFSSTMQPLEHKDMKDGYSATKLTLSGESPLAEASNCNYASFTYAPFERSTMLGNQGSLSQWFEGEVSASGVNAVSLITDGSITPHSGAGSVSVGASSPGPYYRAKPSQRNDAGETIETGLLCGRTYRIIAWVHASSPANARLLAQLTGNYTTEASMARGSSDALVVGDWIRLDVRIAVPLDFTAGGSTDGLTVRLDNSGGTGTAYFDDLLVYPIDASINGAVWDERRGLLKEAINQEGFLTRYTHDAAGSIIKVHQETERGMHLVQRSETSFQKPF